MPFDNDKNNHFEVEEIQPSEGSSWLVTFADLTMLVLVFFILLFSVSTVDVQRFNKSFQSVRSELSGKDAFTSQIKQAKENTSIIDSVRLQQQLIQQQEKTFSEIRTYLTEAGKQDNIAATFDKGKITLRLPADLLFEPGSVELSEAAKGQLNAIADILIKNKDQDINIKGYTDNVEPVAGRFKDSWEISSLRAVNVLRYLMSIGIESSRLTATGLSSLNPLFPPDSDENRAMNRRIEFELERKVGND